MIIKVSARGEAARLAHHLTNSSENEEVSFSDSRYLSVWNNQPVYQSLLVIDALAAGTGKNKNLLHVSVNPDQNLDNEQWQKCWFAFEQEYALLEQAYIEVTHTKKGRTHKHRVYNRIKENGTEISIWHSYLRNEKLARKLEYAFGHELTYGKHNRAVINQLEKEGFYEIVQWMGQQRAADIERPVADRTWQEEQQQKRTKVDLNQVRFDLKEAFAQTLSGQEFEALIIEKGYLLARGEREGKNGRVRTSYVIVDQTGNVHGLRRRLGVRSQELKEKLSDLPLSQLPTVNQVKDFLDDKGRRAKEQRQQQSQDEQLSKLVEERESIDAEIQQIEEVLARQDYVELQEVLSSQLDDALVRELEELIPALDLDTLNQLIEMLEWQEKQNKHKKGRGERQQLSSEDSAPQTEDISAQEISPGEITPEQLNYQQESESERGEPLGRANQLDAGGDTSDPDTTKQDGDTNLKSTVFDIVSRVGQRILSLKGNAAEQEREYRLHLADVAVRKPLKPDPNHRRPVRAYLTALGQHLKVKGRAAYRTADKWLAEKLAKRGYSKDAIRRALFRASPELLNQQPGQRQSYVRRLVDRVQNLVQQEQLKKPEAQKKLEKPDRTNQRSSVIATIIDNRVPGDPAMGKGKLSILFSSINRVFGKKSAQEVVKKETKKEIMDKAAKEAAEKEARERAESLLKATMRSKERKIENIPKKTTEKESLEQTTKQITKSQKDKSPQARTDKSKKEQESSTPKKSREDREFNELMGERAKRLREAFENAKTIKEKDSKDLTNKELYQEKLLQTKDSFDKKLTKNGLKPMTKAEFEKGINEKTDLEIAKALIKDGQPPLDIKEGIKLGSPEAGMLPKDMREPYAQKIADKATQWYEQVQNQRPERSLYQMNIPPMSPEFDPGQER